MALYGDMNHVRQLLRPKDGSAIGADNQARLDKIQVAVSSYIEEQTGRTFGAGPAAASGVVIQAPAGYAATFSSRLLLPKPIRTISSVAVDPIWTDGVWSGGTVIAATDYRPAIIDEDGNALALDSVNGFPWFGRYLVTGIWADADDDEEVPADITYIAGYLIAEVFKAEQTSAAAVSGPDGATLPMKNPYKNALVATTLEKYRVIGDLVVV